VQPRGLKVGAWAPDGARRQRRGADTGAPACARAGGQAAGWLVGCVRGRVIAKTARGPPRPALLSFYWCVPVEPLGEEVRGDLEPAQVEGRLAREGEVAEARRARGRLLVRPAVLQVGGEADVGAPAADGGGGEGHLVAWAACSGPFLAPAGMGRARQCTCIHAANRGWIRELCVGASMCFNCSGRTGSALPVRRQPHVFSTASGH
jgi:hypothetical protein